MPDLGPITVTLIVILPLLALGLLAILLAEGPEEFRASFRRGGAAVRSRWRNYLLDAIGFFSLAALGLGLMVTLIAAGAVIYFLLRGPHSALQDYRLYLPLAWTVFWICILLACNSRSEELRARADQKEVSSKP